jgi:hypothetical protein
MIRLRNIAGEMFLLRINIRWIGSIHCAANMAGERFALRPTPAPGRAAH